MAQGLEVCIPSAVGSHTVQEKAVLAEAEHLVEEGILEGKRQVVANNLDRQEPRNCCCWGSRFLGRSQLQEQTAGGVQD